MINSVSYLWVNSEGVTLLNKCSFKTVEQEREILESDYVLCNRMGSQVFVMLCWLNLYGGGLQASYVGLNSGDKTRFY